MIALVKTHKGFGNMEIQDIPVPEIKDPNDVLIKIKAAGICGTDLHIYRDEFIYYPPVVLGHEFSGVVEQVGKNVKTFAVGDRVVGEPHTKACGTCYLCREGKIQICDAKRSPGWGQNGAFTDYLIMPENLLHKIPDGVPYNVASLCEPLSIVFTALIRRIRIKPLDFVAVIGSGPIGILSALAAKACGARTVAVLGTNDDEHGRFAVAKELGADIVMNVELVDAKAELLGLTGGVGVDSVIECSGSQGGINTAIEIVKKCGSICAMGTTQNTYVDVMWNELIVKTIDVNFAFSSEHIGWEKALSYLGSVTNDLSKMITHETTINKWKEIFDELQQGNAIKGVFIFD